MTLAPTLDLAAVKARQQATWASGDYSEIATLIVPVAERLCDAADLTAGSRVLDVAAGTGNAAIAAARLGCDVTAVDYVPALLERGRERAAAERVRVDFVEGDAEVLPVADESFAATVSVFGTMFAPNHEQTAAEMLRVTRPGGTIALASWTPDGFLGGLFRTIAAHVPPPVGLSSPMLWGTEAHLADIFGSAVAWVHRVQTFTFRFTSAEALVERFATYYGPTLKALDAAGDAREALLEDLRDLALSWNRLGQPGPIAVPGAYLESVGVPPSFSPIGESPTVVEKTDPEPRSGRCRSAVYGASVPTASEQRRVPSVSRIGYVLVALSAAFAAGNGVAGRLVIDAGVTPRELSAVRIYGAALILFVVVAPHLSRLTRGDMLHLVPFAVVGFVAGQGLYFQAISRVDIAVVLVIVFTAPLVVALYQRLVHDESLPRYAYGAMGVAVLGLALAVLGSGEVGSLSVLGIGLAGLTMISYSVTVLIAARPSTDLPPLVRTGTGLGLAAFVWFAMVPPWTLPFDLLDETTSFDGRVGFSLPVWTAVAFVVVIGTVAVYGTWVAGTSLIGAGAASVVGMTEPMLGAIFAWVLLAQSLTAIQSIGIATTAGGIIVVEQARVRRLRDDVSDVPVDL